ncbi:MAG: hypothetical protein GWO39_08675, partial [Gammaproteobacteria bacterium]|nr:hypothetical protein [Gammaproteobacteria bacterium]NIY32422.1 hypothetical protein [Gammaproteobacteria bacterium]
MSTSRFVGLALLVALAVSACGDDDGTSPSEAPTSVTGVSGNNQTAVVGQALTNPITVRVTDESAEPVSGVDV